MMLNLEDNEPDVPAPGATVPGELAQEPPPLPAAPPPRPPCTLPGHLVCDCVGTGSGVLNLLLG